MTNHAEIIRLIIVHENSAGYRRKHDSLNVDLKTPGGAAELLSLRSPALDGGLL